MSSNPYHSFYIMTGLYFQYQYTKTPRNILCEQPLAVLNIGRGLAFTMKSQGYPSVMTAMAMCEPLLAYCRTRSRQKLGSMAMVRSCNNDVGGYGSRISMLPNWHERSIGTTYESLRSVIRTTELSSGKSHTETLTSLTNCVCVCVEGAIALVAVKRDRMCRRVAQLLLECLLRIEGAMA